jgi:hypothetical protein
MRIAQHICRRKRPAVTDLLNPPLSRSTLREVLPAVVDDSRVTLYTRWRTFPYFWKSRAHGMAAYSVDNHTYDPRHYGDHGWPATPAL